MDHRLIHFSADFGLLLLLAVPAYSQTVSRKSSGAANSQQAPFVIQEYATRVRFENDGTGKRELRVRIEVESDAGAQQLRQLVFSYNAASERMDVGYAQVHKPGGAVITIGPDAVKDSAASVTRDAPAYANYNEKHITVPALRPGDTLEYDIITQIETPPAAGQFWYEHDFLKGGAVQDEQLEVNVPRDRVIKLKTAPDASPILTEAGGRRIYRWKRSHLKRPTTDDGGKEASRGSQPPAVQLTTFANWAEVGRWYAHLERNRIVATPEIRAKALEVTRGRATKLDKIEALYDYVSKRIRFVNLSFGLGGYQPHAAAGIFANRYGDCKDEYALLAAMLEAIGVRADAVLIPFSRKLDPEIPSPAQFDHVITAVPTGKGWIWLDTTPGAAPFRLLTPNLRGKKALLVPAYGLARLVETPADPPFLSTQLVEVHGLVSELGKLTAHFRYTLRGDNEFALRMAFHRTPRTQWNQIGQTIALLDGLDGVVSNVKPSDPAATHDPFELSFDLSTPNFLDWSSKKNRLSLPLPSFGMPEVKQNATEQVNLGSPLDVATKLTLVLPAQDSIHAPVAVALSRDYADYQSLYKVEGNVVKAERTLCFRMRELPASRATDYLAFVRAVEADEGRQLAVENAIEGSPGIPAMATEDELLEAGTAALKAGNTRAAILLLERVVQLDPKHKSAWNNLGFAHLRLGEYDAAAQAFRQQLQVNPFDADASNYLGITLVQQKKYDEAANAFRQQIVLNPLDKTAHAALGGLLVRQKEYKEALPELQKAAVLTPEDAALHMNLGQAYLNLSQPDQAMTAFDKAAQLAPTPETWNNIAYELAQHNIQLGRAQRYAETAVETTAASLRDMDLEHLTAENLAAVTSLGAYWDTLGWIYFERGELTQAEPFLRAAWLLDQSGEVADHLAQLYAKRGQKELAIHTYELALAAERAPAGTRGRLAALLGGDAGIDSLVKQAAPELEKMRTISLGKSSVRNAEAQFFVLFAPGQNGPAVKDVKFIRGDAKLQPYAEQLRAASYPVFFPPGALTRLVRSGTLRCSVPNGGCSFILDLPEKAFAAN